MLSNPKIKKQKKLLIVGDSAFAEIAHEYFEHDSEYEVVAFAVERTFLNKKELLGKPVIALEDCTDKFHPGNTFFYVAIVYTQLNRLRTRLYLEMKRKGYRPASYVSNRAFVWQNVVLGEHVFIFEDNTLQAFSTVEDNVVLWSGNHLGHHSKIGRNCFIASHAVISGFCEIGENSFIGVNATIANNVNIGKDNWIGLGVTIARSTEENQLYKGARSEVAEKSTLEYFKVTE